MNFWSKTGISRNFRAKTGFFCSFRCQNKPFQTVFVHKENSNRVSPHEAGACDIFMSLNEEGYCVPNTCVCPHGTASSSCFKNGQISCDSCSLGFYQIDTECIPNLCECPHGTPAYPCPMNNDFLCESCDAGLYLEDATCKWPTTTMATTTTDTTTTTAEAALCRLINVCKL